ncbi:hypothetical protein FB567DRAFT_98177 [Paraphoma chrysanthemicola]|uniref:Uncharacterized protein n=1 Tax=Paraphoma chrysanthemicola TaxID=798071 RepID=A0A8K0VWK0_9PLEO|nr:hypothetical protein FB567DRAFT_98177 [Paraphoma chrysanthemicola]
MTSGKAETMQTEQSNASSCNTASPKANIGPTRETSGAVWAESDDQQLLQLSRVLPMEEIQQAHFAVFSVDQLKGFLADAQTRFRDRMIHAEEFQPGGVSVDVADAVDEDADDDDDDDEEEEDEDDEVIDAGFAARRGSKPVWEGKTSTWESKSKPGIGWLPENERPDMKQFVRVHGKPLGK